VAIPGSNGAGKSTLLKAVAGRVDGKPPRTALPHAIVAGCTHPFSSLAENIRAIRQRVRADNGLPTPVGVARTKHLAKIALQPAKSAGLAVSIPTLSWPRHVAAQQASPVAKQRLNYPCLWGSLDVHRLVFIAVGHDRP
jgi:energy-coupling factor transporter ATP-binding protein EcfA2